MGFTSGFLGGLTLTYGLIYMTGYLHKSNRTHQALLLRQQARLLNAKVDPPEPEYEIPAYRVEQAGLSEQFKDGWNRELGSVVHKIQDTNWEEVRIRWENRLGHVWGKAMGTETAQIVQENAKQAIDQASESAKAAAEKAQEVARNAAKQAQEQARVANEQAHKKAKAAVETVEVKSKEVAKQLQHKTGEAARQVRHKVNEGVASVKEAVQGADIIAQKPTRQKRLLEIEI